MSDIIIFDKANNRIKDYIRSVVDSTYKGRTDVVIFDDANPSEVDNIRNLVKTVDRKYLIHEAGAIREMRQAEKDQVDSDILASQITRIRASAQDQFDGQTVDGQVLRALVKVLLDEINTLRQNPLAVLAPRTLAQAKTAIQNAIQNGEVDE